MAHQHPNTPARMGQRLESERAALQAGTKPRKAFTRKDGKELAGTILAFWLAGLLIGIFYYAQLAGHLG